MNLSEFKNGIAERANANSSVQAESEISLATIFNVVNSRPTFTSAGFARLKTTSKSNFNSKGNYYLVNLAVTTAQRKQWTLALVGELAKSLGFSAKGLTTEDQVKDALASLPALTGATAKYGRELMNAVTAVAITRNADFTLGQFVDASFEIALSTATGMQELRFSTLTPVQAEIARPAKSSLLSVFGDSDELSDNVLDGIATSAVQDEISVG